MIKILHAADLHLDSPFDGLPGNKAALRRSEQRAMLSSIMELADNEDVDIILFAGDILDSSSARIETAEQLAQVFASVSIPIFISPGNHDFISPNSPYSRLSFPENVHIFRSRDIECVELPALGARIWGAGFTDSTSPSLLADFEAEKHDDILDIMCIHGEVGAKNSSYNPISIDELARSGMDYVALGHIHSFSGVLLAGETAYAWPGCPEGRGFDETGEKGVIIAQVQADKSDLRFVPLDGRRYEIIKVDLTDKDNHLAAIIQALPENCTRDIYRIILTGECEAVPDMNAINAELDGKFFAHQLRDSTIPKKDIWEDVGSDTLRGLFLTRLREKYDHAGDDSEKTRIIAAVRWGLAALDSREEPYGNQ